MSRPLAFASVAALVLGLLTAAPISASSSITVDRTDDVPAASACTVAVSDCSLRGAVIFANANAGTTINLPAGTYVLNIAGSPTEVDGNCGIDAVGDLDFRGNNTIVSGAGAATTIIEQTTGDRVICLNPLLTADWNFTMSGVTITGGRNNDVNGAAGLLGGGLRNLTTLSDCVFLDNKTVARGQYGGALGNFGGDLTINNCTFGSAAGTLGNVSAASGGGAISYTSGDPAGTSGASGTLTVTNSTFLNNTAGGSGGGAIDIYQANKSTTNASISGSTFKLNSAPNGSGGAIEIETGNAIDINSSTFTTNFAHEFGGAIFNAGLATTLEQDSFVSNTLADPTAAGGGGAIGQNQGGTTVHYSRFRGNINASPGQANTVYVAGGTFDAADNWWGKNSGPAASGDVVGTSPATWLQLRHTSNVSNVLLGGVASLSADLLGRNSGGAIASSNLVGLPSFPVSGVFGNSVRGVLSGASTQFVNGLASATWTAGTTSAACGLGGADAVADSQTVTAPITVRCPDLTATKTNDKSGSVVVGEAWTWTITVANGGDADGTFSTGQTVLFDQLPNSSVSYGTPSSSNANVGCSIDGSQNLTCSAISTLTLIPTASFTVTVTSTATAAGSAANPRAAGTCAVDSDAHVVESNEGNNACSNTVTVNKAATTTTISPAPANPSIVGNPVTVQYHVAVNSPGAGAPTGNVTVSDGVDQCTATVLLGTCDITLTTLGLRSLVATYAGDDNFLTSASSGTSHEVDGPPSISSANQATFAVGSPGSFTVTTAAGYPTATTVTRSGVALPSNLSYIDNGDGTGTLSGTPATGTGGTYALTFTASNGISPDAVQSFTLTITELPSITSANHVNFTAGVHGTFTITTNAGFPVATTITETGALPGGVTFTDNGDGTAKIAGTTSASGSYPLTITASNSVAPDPTQSFTLSVDTPPSITSLNHTTFTEGSAGTFTVATTPGFPPATGIFWTGALPTGVTFTDNRDGTATLAGTPAAGTGGTYPLTITASNGISPDPSQIFTLTVNGPPAITSANHVTFDVGVAGSFTVTTAVSQPPATALIQTGDALPSAVTFIDNGDGTATLSGTPATGTGGSYHLTITASNGINPDAVQNFTLTVDESIVIPPPPTPAPIVESLRGGGLQVDHRVPGLLDWSGPVITGASPLPAAVTYELQVRTKQAGVWTGWLALDSGLDVTQVKRSFYVDVWYQFRVRAVGPGGPSHWSTGSKFLPQLVDDASSAITYSGTWSAVGIPSAFGGTVHRTTQVGAAARMTFTGNAIGVVMPTGPGYGTVKVCIDPGSVNAECQTVNLAAWPPNPRRMVFAASDLHGSTHVLKITLVSVGVIGLAIDVNALIR